jgi:hypothetical protein
MLSGMVLALTPLFQNLLYKSGFVYFFEKLVAYVNFLFGNGASPYIPSFQNLTPALDQDVDSFTSTDFEDLLVFTLDALELLWQDVNLVIEICGDNVFALGLGVLSLGSLTLLSRKVFSTKRLKR